MKRQEEKLFNDIFLHTEKNLKSGVLYINDFSQIKNYVNQNWRFLEYIKNKRNLLKTARLNKGLHDKRTVLCISDPYLKDLAVLLKQSLFADFKSHFGSSFSIIETKNFFVQRTLSRDIEFVIFIGQVDAKYVQYCLQRKIFLVNVLDKNFFNDSKSYNLPVVINNLSSLLWFLVFYKNI